MIGVIAMAVLALGAREAVVEAAAEQVGRQVQRVIQIMEGPKRPVDAPRAELVEFATRLLGHACLGRIASALAAVQTSPVASAR
jgi:hypothetical protein